MSSYNFKNLSSLKKWAHGFVKSESNKPQAHVSEMIPTFHNVVITAHLRCKLNLREICYNCPNVEYKPRKFNGIIMKIKEPRTTALIFSTGKIVCLGAKSIEDAHLAARKYARLIQRVGFSVKFSNFKVENMVATYNVGFSIQLVNLASTLGPEAFYDTDMFTLLIYKMTCPKVSMFISSVGYIIITGAKSIMEVQQAFNNVYSVIKEHAVRKKTLKQKEKRERV